ncbi:hypothetical protein AX16_001623 [Volvariella volvacea WC 439]|nr:hypothetical protein AX16_001623 [Volvariella volvacea WC 439]
MSTKTFLERINKLTGPNYREWADSIKAFLHSQGFWQLVVGNEVMVEEVPDDNDNHREHQNWVNRDDQALGCITLRVTDNLKYLIKDNDTSHTAWTQLAEKFGTLNAVIVFGDFHKAMNFRISGNDNPESECQMLATYFRRLHNNDVIIPKFIQAMMLLAAIPQKWDNVSMTLLAQYDMDGLTFDIVNAAIVAEYNRKSNVTNGTPQAKKILAVKHKEGDSKWKEQKSSGNSDKKSNKHGKCSGKHRNKGDKKKNKDNSHLHAHSHLASAVYVLDTFPDSTPTTTSNKIISPAAHSLLERIHDAPAQAYTGQCHHRSVFPIVNAAHTLAECCKMQNVKRYSEGYTPTQHNTLPKS